MDITRDVTYRGFLLNDSTMSVVPGGSIGSGISGCVLDTADTSELDIVQFMEKRSLQDGMDAGDPYLGKRVIRIAGTLYATTRGLLFDRLQELKSTLSPTLAFLEDPSQRGFLPLYYSEPTNNIVDYPSGAIGKQMLAMPHGLSFAVVRDQIGGSDDDALAIPWQAVMVCKDPRITASAPQDLTFTATTLVTGATGDKVTHAITKASHGLVDNDRVHFTTLTGGAGLSTSSTYWVVSATTNTFKVADTQGGAEHPIINNYTDMQYVKVSTQGGTNVLNNRGDYHAPMNMLLSVGPEAGWVTVDVAGSQFTITLPLSTGSRIVRYNGTEKYLTVEEAGTEALRMDLLTFQNKTTHPLIPAGAHDLSVVFSGVVLQSSSHLWFWESYA